MPNDTGNGRKCIVLAFDDVSDLRFLEGIMYFGVERSGAIPSKGKCNEG